MSTIIQDLKHTFRLLAQSPAFAAIAILTLALGIGANTAIFSVVNSLLLHPNGIDHPERVVAARAHYEKLHLDNIDISVPDFNMIRKETSTYSAVALEQGANFNYSNGDYPERFRAAKVTQKWFEVFAPRHYSAAPSLPKKISPTPITK